MTPLLKTSDRALVRYLIIQGCLSIAVSLIFGAGMLAGDVGGITSLIAHPDGLLIFLVGAVTTISRRWCSRRRSACSLSTSSD